MTFPVATSVVIVDLSNLCRDVDLQIPGKGAADHDLLAAFVAGLQTTEWRDHAVYLVADRSLLPLVSVEGRKRLKYLEQIGDLEFCSLADEQILEYAFGAGSDGPALIASKDNFDDFRRLYPEIQGSTDRFLTWVREPDGSLSIIRRDMGDHDHQRLSRKEESAELKARRLRRDTVVRRARTIYFSCRDPNCLLAQLWPDRIPELPKYDGDADEFVCPSCTKPLREGEPRSLAVQLVVFLDGAEQFRILLDDGRRIEVGRKDSAGCIGVESRVAGDASAAVSRSHVAFSFDGRRVEVSDLGSRNGTVLRHRQGKEPDRPLEVAKWERISRQQTVALPSGITIELSGRTIGLSGEQPKAESSDADDDRATRLVTRR